MDYPNALCRRVPYMQLHGAFGHTVAIMIDLGNSAPCRKDEMLRSVPSSFKKTTHEPKDHAKDPTNNRVLKPHSEQGCITSI